MNGKSIGSGVLAILANSETLGHSTHLLRSNLSSLSNEDNYPVCVLFQAAVRIKWKCQSVICKMLCISKELGSNW